VGALRGAMRQVVDALPPDEMRDMRERFDLILAVPELRARMLEDFTRSIQLAAALVAERVGRPENDFAVRTLAGALIGVAMAAMVAAMEDAGADFFALLDAGLEQLETGLRL